MSLSDWFYRAFLQPPEGTLSKEIHVSNGDIILRGPSYAPPRDEFAAWRNDPTTRFVMAALRRNADECKEAWLADSWGRGTADQRTLDVLRERSDALLGFTSSYEAFCETLGLAPEPEQENAA